MSALRVTVTDENGTVVDTATVASAVGAEDAVKQLAEWIEIAGFEDVPDES